ncbi:serpentine type 7TM GPCR chemoreceptor srsx domain-containing protein [Ditylenchus destructor]|uniref:Serpentine type 7TM GPCR chemoreceptor srsx domain-containing protein n=1 Tax=Ditylenchus destructor TaxID=166010 RepID=A0AAD4MST0_9BILA|nr:serpentine type 7TM GPCR chemoreceptor srsx domain-containing protein [Ditylenchus destructor]
MSNSNDTLYFHFNGVGFAPILVIVFGIKWVAGTIGVFANADLIYVTIKHNSLHSACNYLLAINAFFNLLYQTNHIIPFVISILGINFVSLPMCFYLQVYGIYALHTNLGVSLSIGFDRLLSVAFITWQSKLAKFHYISAIVIVCSVYGLWIVFQCVQVELALPNMPVLCSASDCYQLQLSTLVPLMASIFISANVCCYAIVWILLIGNAIKRRNLRDAFTGYSVRIYKSLTVIMFVEIVGYLSNYVARLFVLPQLHLSAIDGFYVASAFSILTNLGMASNAFILYTFSREYNRVFKLQFRLIGTKFGCTTTTTGTAQVHVNVSTIRANSTSNNQVVSSSRNKFDLH